MLEGHRAMESITLDRGEMHLKVRRETAVQHYTHCYQYRIPVGHCLTLQVPSLLAWLLHN